MLAVPVALGIQLAGPPWKDPAYTPLRVGAPSTTQSTSSTSTTAADVTTTTVAATTTVMTKLPSTTITTARPTPARSPATTTTAAGPAPGVAPPFPGTLSEGARGEPVAQWEEQMRSRGWSITPDTRYDARTKEICTAFQRQKGLKVSGQVDEATWNATWNAPLPDQTS